MHTSSPPIKCLFNNLEISINSGQVFLWEKFDNSWYGIYGDHVLKFSTSTANDDGTKNNSIEFFSFPDLKGWEERIFRLDDDIQKILSGFSNDILISEAIKKYPGLRLMRQEPHQCMLSFVCSSNTNIPMIRRMLKNLCRKYGSKVVVDGREFFTFPRIDCLNRASVSELLSCGVGYRAKAIKAVAHSIALGSIDVNDLMRASYDDAKEELLKIYGIGNKIADCILLFSLEKLEAFPIDIWIAKALSLHYSWLLFGNKKEDKKWKQTHQKISSTQYKTFSESIRSYFGKYSGYAQQYLFYHMRQSESKRW
ncbi:MAG TPA: DNA glycosylase [Nitrososphaeraceae archaeon]|nr:DNA glycosylase [Nitrososphaeraceae archaeon]